MFNLANKLTLARVLAAPVLVILLYFPPNKAVSLVAALVFVGASLTDIFDGFVARSRNQVTNFGKFLDPLADKILICSVLIMLVRLEWVQAWIAIAIIGREITVTGIRAAAADKGMVIAADKFGKAKTILQVMALIPLLLHYPWWGFDPTGTGAVLLYAALFLTVFSGANYLYNFYKNWLKEENTDG
ncbi:MAG: CDP-diacylglycerol--glycerol-3-phosphate 3-phosphatidyltransferase [Thermodesulfobacteriota bacterium]|nr:CDP-diacylglycerol--glycerol-3-phosphate 3-phosphatidyltransferase [Thermodesulfobacteriota bacterium]